MAKFIYLSVRLKGDDIILQNKVGLKLFGDTPENVAKEEALDLANINFKGILLPENIEYGFVMNLEDEVTNWQSLEVDLFDNLDALSPTMQKLIEDLGEAIEGNFKPDYDAWVKKFEDKGYTFDFEMDGHAYNLRLLTEEEKLKNLFDEKVRTFKRDNKLTKKQLHFFLESWRRAHYFQNGNYDYNMICLDVPSNIKQINKNETFVIPSYLEKAKAYNWYKLSEKGIEVLETFDLEWHGSYNKIIFNL
jgi:hypothetical protein